MKKISFLLLGLLLLSCAPFVDAQTAQKGLIGRQDFNNWDGKNLTFDRKNSVGGTSTLLRVGTEIDVLAAFGSSNADLTDACISRALNNLGLNTKAGLLLSPGTWTISSNVDWSAWKNVIFRLAPGTLISHGAYTMNIPNLTAPLMQIFSGTGVITLSGVIPEVYPEWWAANTTPGTTDMATAIQSALNTLVPVKLAQTKYFSGSQLDLKGNSLLGTGYSFAGSSSTELKFGATLGANAAIVTRIATALSSRVAQIRDMYIYAANWADVTGHGLDIEAPLLMENSTVSLFPGSNIIMHHDASSVGPYESYFKNCVFSYAGQHGVVVGTGANNITFANCQFKWNGAPSWGVAPTVAGNYDGFLVNTTLWGYPAYNPNNLSIYGGDASYNSRYGWNFDLLTVSAAVFPGYAEGNLHATYQVRVGSVVATKIHFSTVSGGKSKVYHNSSAGLSDAVTSAVYLGGELLGNGIALGSGNYTWPWPNAWSIFMAWDGTNFVALAPDNTNGNLTIGASGTAKILLTGIPTYADNTAALAAGLTAGMIYKNATGSVMVVY